MNRPWFGPKRYGMGLSPTTWQGWLATLIFIGLIALAAAAMRGSGRHPTLWNVFAFGGLTAAYIALAVWKSDRQPWRWRWGGD